MRPYMLWLTRVYAGHVSGYGTAFLAWPNVLDDWLDRQFQWRHRSGPGTRSAHHSTTGERYLGVHSYTPIEIQRLAADRSRVPGRARGAVQGGR